jgi:hypothetical protein
VHRGEIIHDPGRLQGFLWGTVTVSAWVKPTARAMQGHRRDDGGLCGRSARRRRGATGGPDHLEAALLYVRVPEADPQPQNRPVSQE